MPRTLALGLDFGTSSCRALLVDVATGEAAGSGVGAYPSGESGVLGSVADPLVARQRPGDYRTSAAEACRAALAQAEGEVVGIGVDTTASTPIPVDGRCVPLADQPGFEEDLDAMAWLWKDHSAHAEAAEVTSRASELPYLGRCGGAYSSEWYWSKLLRARRSAPAVASSACAWLELQDYVPAWLCGAASPRSVARGVCAAGHKGLWSQDWGGFPSEDFLTGLDPRLSQWCAALGTTCLPAGSLAGRLAAEPARLLGLPPGIPVSVGAIDAHLGAVGAGVRLGRLVKILGTSSCDILVGGPETPLVEGVSGVVPDSVLPGYVGIEAGQAAVGDLFDWWARLVGSDVGALGEAAGQARPGQSGLLALDWNNGNRNVLSDPLLSGLLVGQTLRTTAAEGSRAMVEATAFGARRILAQIEGAGVPVEEIVVCGGGASRSPFVMQVYADVLGRPMLGCPDTQACARGAAICGAVAAGALPDLPTAVAGMSAPTVGGWTPQPDAQRVYDELYGLWLSVHDSFGRGAATDLGGLMARLHAVRGRAS
jgi:L-ribulokinase